MSSLSPNTAEFDASGRHGALGVAMKVGLLLGAAMVADHAALSYQRREPVDTPLIDVHTTPGADRIIFTLFGMNIDSRSEGVRFHQTFGHHGSVANVVWPKAKIPHDRLKREIVETRAANPEPLSSVVVHSYGGYELAVAASDKRFRRDMEPVESVTFDASFASFGAISDRGKKWLNAADITPFRYALSHTPWINAPIDLTREQSRFVRENSPAEGSMEGFAQEVFCVQSPHDSWLVNELAYQSIQHVCGDQLVKRRIDNSRPYGAHSGAHYYPDVIEQILAGTYDHTQPAEAQRVA